MIWLLWKIGKTWGARFLAVDQTMEDPKSGQFAGGKLWSLRWKSIKVWWFFDGGFNSFFVPLPMMLPIPSLHYALPLRQSMAGFKLKMFFIFPTGHSLLAESIFFFGEGGGSSSKNLTCTRSFSGTTGQRKSPQPQALWVTCGFPAPSQELGRMSTP